MGWKRQGVDVTLIKIIRPHKVEGMLIIIIKYLNIPRDLFPITYRPDRLPSFQTEERPTQTTVKSCHIGIKYLLILMIHFIL